MRGSLPEGPLISLLCGQLLPKGRSHCGRSFKMPVTIIAEAGVNHNGSLEMAKEMARVAKECGADIVKYL